MADPSRSPSTVRRKGLALAIGVGCCLAAGTAAPSGPDPAETDGETYVSREGIPLPSLRAGELDLSGSRRPQDLYLEVFYGDRSTGRIAHLRLHNGGLSATAEQLHAIGLVVPPGLATDGAGRIPLDALPGLAYRYEPATQRLILQPPPGMRPMQRFGYEPPAPVEARRDPGWLLSYDAYGRELDGDATLAMASALRWFGSVGAFELTGLSRAGDAATRYRRLETRWTYSDPERLWTWTAGDFISGGLPWTRPVRLGGLQWRRNFGVRPDLITLPMPRFSGEATVPSSVELYVNNIRQFGAEVQDGPFVVQAMPRISGSGEASLVVTDALGRVTETSLPLYVDHQRLAPGLTDFSLEAGLPRLGFAGEDDEYGRDPVASASLRHGVSDTLTLEGHGGAGPGVRLAGLGGVWSPANRWGLLAASYARGDGDTRGGQRSFGYQWNAFGYGLDAQSMRRSAGFRDLGDLREETELVLPTMRAQDRGTFWLPIARGSVAFTWLRWRNGDGAGQRIRSLSWTQTLSRRLSLSASVFDDDGGRGGGVTVTVPLGDRLHAGVGARRSRGRTSATATVRRSAPYEGGWGWSVEGGDRPGGYAQAAAEVRGRRGEARFGVDHWDSRAGSFFQGGGSVVLMDGRLFLSRRIHDAFAVVSTNGRGGVPVLSENRLYGRTDSAGYLLVPDLRGWQRNRLAIDPDELAVDYRVGELEQMAIPADRSGVLVPFDVAEVNPAVVTLLGPEGEPVPAGARARLVASGREIVVGFEGEAYIEDATADSVIEVEMDGLRCRYRVPEGAREGEAMRIRPGALPCERLAW